MPFVPRADGTCEAVTGSNFAFLLTNVSACSDEEHHPTAR